MESGTRTVVDQLGRTVEVPTRPRRIVSLVPSQTELLFDLGLDAVVVGRTRYCVRPAGRVERAAEVGGTKQLDLERIVALAPDLIVGNKEENEREAVEQLERTFPVWLSDVRDREAALDMIRRLGELAGRAARADELAADIASVLGRLPRPRRRRRAAYFIWQRPYMVAGRDTFIDAMLDRCGLGNVFATGRGDRYPAVTAEEIRAARPEILLLSSEPFPFAQKHRRAFRSEFEARVECVDGQMFSWYGSRLLAAGPYLADLMRRLDEPGT